MNGAIFVISIDTGCVLDYVLCCKKNIAKNANLIGMQQKNGKKSSKKRVVSVMLEVLVYINSIDKHNLKYTTYVRDYDSSLFGCVFEALEKKCGSDYPIKKEDCIGHVQKGWELP